MEQHFNEEVAIFKNSIQEIIDSQAFASCYWDLLTQTLKQNNKEYNKDSLKDIIKMAEFLYEHFQLPVNFKELQKEPKSLELFKKFDLLLQECQAVLNCEAPQLEPQRVLKRFKILRSILRKLIDELGDKTANGVGNKSQVFLMSDELSDSQEMFASIGISPSIRSILYNNNTPMENRRQQRLLNDSLKANCSKLPTTPVQEKSEGLNFMENHVTMPRTSIRPNEPAKNLLPIVPTQRASLRRSK